jgi:hypothetical protein
MDRRQFVHVIKDVVRDSAVADTIETMEHPPGRKPAADLVARAEWYRTLDPDQKQLLALTIKAAVDKAVFGFFCVLDGVRAIEHGRLGGTLELRYVRGSLSQPLNSPEDDLLHDLFNTG